MHNLGHFAGLHDLLSHLAVLDLQRARPAAQSAEGRRDGGGLHGGSGDPGHEAPALPAQPDERVSDNKSSDLIESLKLG